MIFQDFYKIWHLCCCWKYGRPAGTTAGFIGGLIDGILGIFGANKGEYKNGVFYPGDWSNRLAFANQRITSLGIEGKYNTRVLDALLRSNNPQVAWQGLTDNYLNYIAGNQSNPDNDDTLGLVKQTIDAVGKGQTQNLAGFNTWVIIALVGAGLFLVLGNKKKRGRK